MSVASQPAGFMASTIFPPPALPDSFSVTPSRGGVENGAKRTALVETYSRERHGPASSDHIHVQSIIDDGFFLGSVLPFGALVDRDPSVPISIVIFSTNTGTWEEKCCEAPKGYPY